MRGQHAVEAAQERRHGFGGHGGQLVAEVQDVALVALRHAAQRLGAVGQETGGVAQAHFRQPLAQF